MLKRLVNSFIRLMDATNDAVIKIISGTTPAIDDSYFEDMKGMKDDLKKRQKRAGYALLIAYQGRNYYGMQVQRVSTYPTVERELLTAMVKAGFLTEDLVNNLADFHFQRAARTDKAVSAVRQVCSMRLPRDDNFLKNGPELINNHLPPDIHVLCVRKATPSFNAWKKCDARTYSYTLPTFSFASCDQLTKHSYRIIEERIQELNDVLGVFVGVHNYYNYTSGREHSDTSCNRFINFFKCDRPFLYHFPARNEEYEFVTVYIKGQSFMLHQIRKMIGMAIAVLRGFMYKSDIQRSFEADRMDIPKAPGLGLLLEQLHYHSYDKRYSRTHPSLNDWGEELELKIKEIRKNLIVDPILLNECKTNSMMNWLSTLTLHDYLGDPEDEFHTSSTHLQVAHKLCIPKEPAEEEEMDLQTSDQALDVSEEESNPLHVLNNSEIEEETVQVDEKDEESAEQRLIRRAI